MCKDRPGCRLNINGVCRRVPIIDGKCPEHEDIASIHESLVSAPHGKACFVFNCQQGKGRTTIGMTLATLFLTSPVRSSCLPRCVPEPFSSCDSISEQESIFEFLALDVKKKNDVTRSCAVGSCLLYTSDAADE